MGKDLIQDGGESGEVLTEITNAGKKGNVQRGTNAGEKRNRNIFLGAPTKNCIGGGSRRRVKKYTTGTQKGRHKEDLRKKCAGGVSEKKRAGVVGRGVDNDRFEG